MNEQLLRNKVFASSDLSPTCPGTGWDIRIDMPWRVCTLKHIATNTLIETNIAPEKWTVGRRSFPYGILHGLC